MKTFCWIVVILATIVATLYLFAGLSQAESAPQEAAIAAVAATIVIIPYVFTRAVEGFYTDNGDLKEQNEEIIVLLQTIRDNLKKSDSIGVEQ